MVKIARFNDAFNAGHVRPQKKFWNNYVYPIKRYYNILKFEFSATLLLKLAKTQSLKCYMIWLHRHISKHFLVKSSFKYGSTIRYPILVYTKTVDNVEGARWLARQTPNILCYLPPSNSRENGVLVCIRNKWRSHPNYFFGVY